MKATKKALKEQGEKMNAYYIGGNVYNYENCIHYIQANDIEELKKNTKNEQLINDLREINYKHGDATQLFYSAGYYGNSGQLHGIELHDKDYNLIKIIYVYYC